MIETTNFLSTQHISHVVDETPAIIDKKLTSSQFIRNKKTSEIMLEPQISMDERITQLNKNETKTMACIHKKSEYYYQVKKNAEQTLNREKNGEKVKKKSTVFQNSKSVPLSVSKHHPAKDSVKEYGTEKNRYSLKENRDNTAFKHSKKNESNLKINKISDIENNYSFYNSSIKEIVSNIESNKNLNLKAKNALDSSSSSYQEGRMAHSDDMNIHQKCNKSFHEGSIQSYCHAKKELVSDYYAKNNYAKKISYGTLKYNIIMTGAAVQDDTICFLCDDSKLYQGFQAQAVKLRCCHKYVHNICVANAQIDFALYCHNGIEIYRNRKCPICTMKEDKLRNLV